MTYTGLNEREVSAIREKSGKNSLPSKEGASKISIILSQFKSPLIYIIAGVGAISVLFKEYYDAILILCVVSLNVFMGYFQEHRAQKTLRALREIIRPKAMAFRNGELKEINVEEIVPGDIISLNTGDKIPADGIFLEGSGLLVSEAILTGEGEPIQKTANDGKSLLFMGTTVLSGRGIMRAEKTGAQTEIGKIGESLALIKEEKTPLQKRLEEFSKNLAILIAVVCLIIFAISAVRDANLWGGLKIAIILAVAAIPEGLPIAVTVILTLGMNRILKKNGLVKKLLSIETLGSTSVICTDKTGTLTEGIMKVVRVDFTDSQATLKAIAANNSQRSGIEMALWNYIKEVEGVDPNVLKEGEIIEDDPFDSEKKYSFSLMEHNKAKTASIVGAPEIVLGLCVADQKSKERALAQIEGWASEGLRIIGVAFKNSGRLRERNKYQWLGLVGVQDPLREGVKEAVDTAQNAGIKIKIVTGDYKKTAEKIASDLGLKLKAENIMEGFELETISAGDLRERIDKIALFSRVTPHQKLKIVEALQNKGEIVAMTGDGVNDAPALKRADIGVSVGSATEVAKEASDLILLDSNFRTIVAAVEEGRIIFSNIKKVVAYVLSNSFVEIFLIFGAMLMGLPAPLTIIQILWIHLICDGPPDIVLGFEPGHKGILRERPKDIRREKILNGSMKFMIFAVSFLIGLGALFVFKNYLGSGKNLPLARAVVFAVVASIDLIYIFSFKDLSRPLWKIDNFFQNKYLFLGVIYGFSLIFMAIYIPALSRNLGISGLGLSHWAAAAGMAAASVVVIETLKFVDRKLSR